jgi:hypothetical protein
MKLLHKLIIIAVTGGILGVAGYYVTQPTNKADSSGTDQEELQRALDAQKSKEDIAFHERVGHQLHSGGKVDPKDEIRYLLIDCWVDPHSDSDRILSKPLPVVLEVIADVLEGDSVWTQSTAIEVLLKLVKANRLSPHDLRRMVALVSNLVHKQCDCAPYAMPAGLFILSVLNNHPCFLKEAVKDKVFTKDPADTGIFLFLSAEMGNKEAVAKMIEHSDDTRPYGWLMLASWQRDIPREKKAWKEWWDSNWQKTFWRWHLDSIERFVNDCDHSKEISSDDLLFITVDVGKLGISNRFLAIGKYLPDAASNADRRTLPGLLIGMFNVLNIAGNDGYPKEVLGNPDTGTATKEQLTQWAMLWRNYALLFLAGGKTELTKEESDKVAELIKQLGDEKFDVREAAQASLVQMGPRVYEMLKKHSQDSDPEIRGRIQNMLPQMEWLVQHVKNDDRLYSIPQILAFLLVADYCNAASKRLHYLTNEDFGLDYEKWVSWYEENENFLRFDYSARTYHLVAEAKKAGVDQRAWEYIPDSVKGNWDKLDATARESATQDAWKAYEQEEWTAWFNGVSLDAWREIPEDKRSNWQSLSKDEKQKLLADGEHKLLGLDSEEFSEERPAQPAQKPSGEETPKPSELAGKQ